MLKRRQQRSLLAVLALRAGEVVSTDRLIEDLWGGSAPRSALGSLQNTVSALRGVLGADVVVTQPPGYRLGLGREAVDVHRFDALVRSARGVEPAERAALLRQALELWRGEPLADLSFEPFAAAEIGRLEELRLGAIEDRIDADLALGHHAQLVAELEALVASHALRERLRGQLMVALYRCGRQAEALEVYRAVRLALADELGLDPSPELQELERKVLRQDPELASPDFVAQAPPPAERRVVTVLAGVPASEEDPEALSRDLETLLERLRGVLARHGGELERFGPEGLIATFGAETPRDDDALRAVRAAVELELAAGVATGETVAGAGAVVSRAARLAREGGVQLDSRTYDLVRDAVTAEPDGDAYRLLELDPTAEGWARRLDAPLVGRDDELARLQAAFDETTAERRCRALTVLGEPGDRQDAARTRAGVDAWHAGRGAGRPLPAPGRGRNVPPAPRSAEPRRCRADARLRPGSGARVARLAPLAGGSEAASLGESYWAVRRLLEALGRTRPLLLVLDDVHWAEPALLDLVDYLIDRAEAPILVLCLARPELERPLGVPLSLGPLAPEHARTIVTGTAELPEETMEHIVRLAEGNALYAEQLAVFAAEGAEGLPATLEAVLASRLGRLDPADRAVLQRAAVVGREFSRDAVAALADGDVVRHLLALTRRGLVHPTPAADLGDDGYSFHHILLRDAAYASLTKADRADLHERCAAWVDRDGPGDDVIAGFHLEQAAFLRRELGEDADKLAATAGGRLSEAGMRVWRMNDPAAASSLLARAVALLPTGPRRAELMWEQAIALRLRGRSAEADAALDAAEHEAHRVDAPAIAARSVAERTHGRLLSGELGLDEAIAAFEATLTTLASERDERGLGRVELSAGTVHWLAGNHKASAAAAERAWAHYSAAGFSPAVCIGTYAESLYHGATTVEAGLARCAELLELSPDRMTEANVTTVLGGFRSLAGDADDARDLLDHARGLYEDLGNDRGLLMHWAPYRVEAEALAGNLDAATKRARSNVERLTALGERGYSSVRALRLAELLLLQGDDDEAERVTALAERDALSSDVIVQFLRRSIRGQLLARGGDVARGAAIARDGVRLASLTDELCGRARAHFALAEVLELAGDRPGAEVEEASGRDLLLRKGAKGALVGAPFA